MTMIRVIPKRKRRGHPQLYEVWRWDGSHGRNLTISATSRGGGMSLEMAAAFARKIARTFKCPASIPDQDARMRPIDIL